MEDKQLERRIEISSKLFQMGDALVKEAKETNDFCVGEAGSLLIIVAGVMLDKYDIQDFSLITSMFTAKRILDEFEKNNINVSDVLNKFKDIGDNETENLSN